MGSRDPRLVSHIRYVFNGREVPSVTTISNHTPKPDLYKWYWNQGRLGIPFEASLRRAADVGKIVHSLIEAGVRGEDCDLSAYAKKDVDAGVDIAKRILPVIAKLGQPVRLEVPIVCRKYGGTPDGIFQTEKGNLLVDYKTSNSVHTDHFVQLAGYVSILSGNHRMLEQTSLGTHGKWVDSNPLKIQRAMIIHAPRNLRGVMCVEIDERTLKKALQVFKVRYLMFVLDRHFRRFCDGK